MRSHSIFRHAIERLALLSGRSGVVPSMDPNQLLGQLSDLLSESATQRVARTGRAPRVLFVLDGLDEIERLDPSFLLVPFQLVRSNVVWLCAGRTERSIPEIFAVDRCTHVFPGELPAMSDEDIRAMLIDRTGGLKYDLFRLDREESRPTRNMRLCQTPLSRPWLNERKVFRSTFTMLYRTSYPITSGSTSWIGVCPRA